jgi:hypothetical protein
MKSQNLSTDWWEGVKQNKNSPWTLMKANDPNNQTNTFNVVKDKVGRYKMVVDE